MMNTDVPAHILRGRNHKGDFRENYDAIIVGSGAGGAVVATILAEAGKRVLILEEGPYYSPSDYQTFTPSQTLRRMFREAGMLTAFGVGQTPIIAITIGRAVGGSSTLTGGVCFRIPSSVHHHWIHELGLDALSERSLETAYTDVEKRMMVTEVPESMRSKSTHKFVEGATKLGIPMKPLRRNTGHDCEGNTRCNFTCPAGAKRSVDISYLPSAFQHGAVLLSDALVENVIVKNHRAAGIEGRLLNGPDGRPGGHIHVTAPIVVLAAGTLHTPLILFRSNIGRSNHVLGRNITLHPAVRVMARFDESIHGWDGAMQSVYSDHFAAQGIKLVGIYTSPNVLAAGLPGFGPEFRRRIRALPNMGTFGAMIHDDGGGRVLAGPGREPILSYEMAPRDLYRLRRSITILSEIALAAGAREVFTSVFGFPPIKTMEDAIRMEQQSIDARRIECMAFHPLGSARMSNDARRGIVDQSGESFEVPGLFIADGSILPTSIGVNSQVPIMAMATRIAWGIVN